MDDTKTKDSRDRSKPGAPEAPQDNDQRRFRGQHSTQETAADKRRDAVRGEETAHDAPTDPMDDAFLKSTR